ncbi:hypothetical protein DFJ43DRAFT_992742 [Lentinula guzmanii]|uniref:C2H2-type domain-containing protein n=2 Tax=Lentinula TaxID=5352 RepID=A0AA38N367_9AGAR|nr:hypothetical protein DFJ43DRAFT_992742 [Lentinula guzmanii]KAJ3784584.1 hypothetical protein GGU10DRAFT_24095 [Lentinula aff. detonsa]
MLPSVLPSRPALSDTTTTREQLETSQSLAKVTTPQETAIFICALQDCHKLFPSRDRLIQHRRKEHGSDEDKDIITWND